MAVVPAAVAQIDGSDVVFRVDPEVRAIRAAPAERADGQYSRLIHDAHAEAPAGDGVAVRRLGRDVGRGQERQQCAVKNAHAAIAARAAQQLGDHAVVVQAAAQARARAGIRQREALKNVPPHVHGDVGGILRAVAHGDHARPLRIIRRERQIAQAERPEQIFLQEFRIGKPAFHLNDAGDGVK